MAMSDCRAPRSAVLSAAVLSSAVSRSVVAIRDEERVLPDRSCTPERLCS